MLLKPIVHGWKEKVVSDADVAVAMVQVNVE